MRRVAATRPVVETAAVAGVAWIYAAVLYRLWDASLRVPLYQDRADARLIANLVQNITTRGWYQSNPHLGAPYGQQLYDFPHGGETWQLAALKVISLFSSDYGLTMNVYFIAGFGVTAAVTLLVLRHLGFGFPAAALVAFLYTFLPFHFWHEESHLFRSSYFYAPLACLVLLWSLSWRERFLGDPEPKPRGSWRDGLVWNLRHNLRVPRVAAAVAVCLVLAGTETMTTAFTITLLAATGALAALRRRDPAQLLVSGALAAVLAVTFLLLLWPTINYVRTYGANEVAARREVIDQERYGLKISAMVLPSPDHRSAVLGSLGSRAEKSSPVGYEKGMALTTLGALGFLGALYRVLTGGWTGRRGREPDERERLLDHAGLIIAVATLFATISGFGLVLGVAGFSQVRVWNRVVLLIAFLSFAFVAHWLERAPEWVRSRRLGRPLPVIVALAVGVAAFGIWDGGVPARRDYEELDADFASDRAFVARIERTVPDGTNVFQIPVIPFPEGPTAGTMLDYDQLRPFLQSDGTTNWSYGAIKGRPDADWQLRIRNHIGTMGALPALLGMGFGGLWVDTFGYDDGGTAIRAELRDVLGVEPMVSPNGRHLYYDLGPYRDRLGRSDADLRALARRQLGVVPPGPGG